MKPLDIVKVEGSERERVVIKSFIYFDGRGWMRVYNKCADIEEFRKYWALAQVNTFKDGLLTKVWEFPIS